MQVEIIFEDEDILVVNKPSGLVVHSDQRTEEITLSDWVLERYPELGNVGGVHMLDMGRTEARCGIVNRLDRDVSGCMVIAKNEASFQNLAKQFLDRKVVKKYIAVVHGRIQLENDDELVVDAPIGRHRKDPRKWATGEDARNTKREAKTLIKILKSTDDFSVLELQPVTGRTHQLRLHTLHLGHPMVGDKRYAEEFANTFFADRIMLHSAQITFLHPKSKQLVTIKSELPKIFDGFVN